MNSTTFTLKERKKGNEKEKFHKKKKNEIYNVNKQQQKRFNIEIYLEYIKID